MKGSNLGKEKYGSVLCGFLVLLYAFLSGNAAAVLIFSLFSLVYIQIPGILLLSAMNSVRKLDAENILLAFFFGLGILILEYCLLSALGLRIVFIVLSPALSLLLIIKRIKEKSSSFQSDIELNQFIQFAAIVLITCILVCVTQRYAFGNIEETRSIFLYQDISWHIGNVAALSNGYPFFDFRFAGLKFNYHYFNDLLFGMCKYCFGISANALVLKCTPIITVYTVALGIYAFFKSISDNTLLGFIMLLCCGAVDTYYVLSDETHTSLLNYHIFTNINGVALSLAAVVAVFLFYVRILDGKEVRKRDLLILAVLVFVMTGMKGPFAIVLIAAMAFSSVVHFIKDRDLYRLISVTFVSGAIFLMTYVVVIKGIENLFGESNNNRATEISVTDTLSRSLYWDNFSRILGNGDKAHLLVYCICLAIIGSVIAAGIYHLLFVADTFRSVGNLLRHKDLPTPAETVAITTGWIGLAGYWLVSHIGFSQAYFLFVAVLFIVGESLRLLDKADGKLIKILIIGIVAVNTVICGRLLFTSLSDMWDDDSEHFAYHNSNPVEVDAPSVLTHSELEGLEWIRDNTDADSVIATDRIDLWSSEYPAAEDDCRSFYYSAFAERQMLIEGFSYSDISLEAVSDRLAINRTIYSDLEMESRNAIDDAGADYVIVTKRFRSAPEHFRDPVFENEDISIYKVR